MWLRRAFVILILIGAAVLYVSRLARSPAYLSIEEVGAARDALIFAKTGRNEGGQRWPLYFGGSAFVAGGGGAPSRDPVFTYLQAALLAVVPFSEAVVRLPSAVAGIVDVLLMFFLARRLFKSEWLGVVAAALLATSPAHFFQSRIATQQIGIVPFVLAWLLFLTKYFDDHRTRDLLAAVLALGAGTYAYLAAYLVMPVYVVLTAIVVVIHHRARRARGEVSGEPTALRSVLLVFGGFALALVPALVWNLSHTARLPDLINYYTHNGYNTDLGTSSVADTLVARLDTWWNAFGPDKLFLTGDGSLRFSTRQVGFFLLPIAILLPVGLFNLKRAVGFEFWILIVAALLLGPLPAVSVRDFEVKRWLTFLPFVTLTATVGVWAAFSSPRRLWGAGAAALLLLCLLEFSGFLRFYWGPYREYSSFYFGKNLRGAIDDVLSSMPAPGCVLLDTRVLYLIDHWNLYAMARGRDDLVGHAKLVDSEDAEFAPPRSCSAVSLIVYEDEVRLHPTFRDRLALEGWSKTTIPETDGSVFLSVFRHAAK